MDAIWIILDSVSFQATPFASEGPETMPRISSLAQRSGIVFTRAYAPGPTSPSSHSSFFTGYLPSETGMHEANPYFNSDLQTIGEAISSESYAISTNPFIFNGLCDGFDETDDLRNQDYLMFPSGSDPAQAPAQSEHSSIERYLNFIKNSDSPVRSLINGVSYKMRQRTDGGDLTKHNPHDENPYQYANTMNKRIREKMKKSTSAMFIIANYMDAHAPLDASHEAIKKFAPGKSKSDLPIGISGQKVHSEVQSGNNEIGDSMYELYKAAIWDLDAKIAPLIEEFIERDSLVIVTADHGNWFRRSNELEDERIHVPLIIFAPEKRHQVIDKSVNLRSLPRTTMQVVEKKDGGFPGVNVLEVVEDRISITELIHDPDEPGSPVNPHGEPKQSIQYDIAAIKSNSRVNSISEETIVVRGDEKIISQLQKKIEELKQRDLLFKYNNESINSDVEGRLKKLGYLD
jgi:arylsulfatase A-like enzyme